MSESTGINNKHRIKQFILSTRKIVFIYVIILFVFVLFQNQIDKAFIKLDLLNLNYGVDLLKVIYAILVIGLSIKAYTNIRSKQIKTLFINSLCITFIYSLYRNDIIAHTQWEFAQLYSSFNYADVIYWVPCIMILKWLVIEYKTNKVKIEPNPADPITNAKQDKFGYSKDTKQLLKKILGSQSMYENSSFVIGLKGEWGLGKTSYLNLLEESCQSESSVEVIRFNPWYSTGYNQIVSNFFNSFNTAIEDSSLSQQLEHYSQSIANANLGWFSACLKVVLNKPTVSLENQHKEINARIQKTEKIYLVLIDDMDRLDKDEILNVIKLIRNAANFCKTVFIIAYDQQYVNNALSEAKLRDPEKYMEKIITCPYNLPKIEEDIRIKTIEDYITHILSISANINSTTKEHINTFLKMIDYNISLRNAVRLAHTVASNSGNLRDKDGEYTIHLADYLSITYLSIIAPEAYYNIEKISNNPTTNVRHFSSKNLICESNGTIKKNKKNEWFDEYESITDIEYKEDRLSPFVHTQSFLPTVYKIITNIFTTTDGVYRISNPDASYLYFTRNKKTNIITIDEVNEILRLSSVQRREKLLSWKRKKETAFIFNMFENIDCETKEAWTSLFNDIYILYQQNTSESSFGSNSRIILPGRALLNLASPQAIVYKEALYEYLRLKDDDNIQTLENKIILLNASPYICARIQDILEIKLESDLTLDIITKYLELKKDYKEFNQLVWSLCINFSFQKRINLRDLFRTHITTHFSSFRINFATNDYISDSNLYWIFHRYDVDSSGRSCTSSDIWIPHFKAFLDEIPNKTEEQEKWIKELQLES